MNELQLETPRLRLRLMRSSDLDDLLKMFGDPQGYGLIWRCHFQPRANGMLDAEKHSLV
jgi:hypothetical protein